jgi:hypothetical protein
LYAKYAVSVLFWDYRPDSGVVKQVYRNIFLVNLINLTKPRKLVMFNNFIRCSLHYTDFK